MHIGIMCHASYGGSARIATELAIALARLGHRVHIFTGTGPLADRGQVPNVELHTITLDGANGLHPATLHTNWSAKDLQGYTDRILQVIDTEGLDVLHFHYAIPFAFVAQSIRDVLGETMPLVIGTLHGTDVSNFGRDPVTGPRLAKALKSSDVLTTVSDSHAQLAIEVFGLTEPPRVIPNFVDLSRFRPSTHWDGDGRPGSRPRIAHVSNFRPVKDPQTMASIFLAIRARIEAELWLIGSGEELDAVRSVFRNSAFEDDVVYLGLRSDVAFLLRQVDLLLMTSLHESFGLVALEAMACGVPVLATRVGGVPEVVMHGSTGMLFPLGDHELAAGLAVNLLSNPPAHRAMRRAAIQHAVQFRVERIVPEYEALYKRVAKVPRLEPVIIHGE